MSTIKCFYFLYTSSKNISIAGAMQRFSSSPKETKTHFLSTHFTHVRDRTACLNSFWFVAYMQTKRVSSNSPTHNFKNIVSPERNVVFEIVGNAQHIFIFYQIIGERVQINFRLSMPSRLRRQTKFLVFPNLNN